jgi:hypothetical protein
VAANKLESKVSVGNRRFDRVLNALLEKKFETPSPQKAYRRDSAGSPLAAVIHR